MNPMRMRPIVPAEPITRRTFLKVGAAAGAGLTLGICGGESAAQATKGARASGASAFAPNAFLRIAPDNSVTVVVKHVELGQGTYTGLPMLVADELDAAWSQVRVEGAPADAKRYNNLFWGESQGTGGSTAMANSFEQYRQAGAAARTMLVGAAAERWKGPPESIAVKNGVVSHPSGTRRRSASSPPPPRSSRSRRRRSSRTRRISSTSARERRAPIRRPRRRARRCSRRTSSCPTC
jgi:isoquinoline 1-oxidoreductase beta subunit